jgi:DNA-directed RNA polymerase subunit M/transcription elongation factor TFIIS
MYYIKLFSDEKTQLSYYCKKCGNEDSDTTNVIVSKIQVKKMNDSDYSHLVNKYTKLDPTLPRKNNVKCPNVKCNSNSEEDRVENEVLFIRYDDVNMRYIYMCCNCDTVWNNV